MPISATLLIRPALESESDDTTGAWLDWSEAASPAVVRAPRIERPALPREDLEALGRALTRLQLDNGVAVIHMGEINREDVIPQMAEFCLQIEGVEWGVVSGLVKDRVVISVRNVGYVKSAGEIMKKLYDDIGSAGGHRSMAKAVVPLDRFKEKFGEVSEKVIREAMLRMIAERDTEAAHG